MNARAVARDLLGPGGSAIFFRAVGTVFLTGQVAMSETSDPSKPLVREVVLSGEIDVENTPRIRRRISAGLRVSRAQGCAVVVDCTAVTFVESRGLGMMARLQRRADEEGLSLSWRGFNEHVLTTIHVTGLDTYLRIEV